MSNALATRPLAVIRGSRASNHSRASDLSYVHEFFGTRLTWSDPPGCCYAILGQCGWAVKAALYWLWSSWRCLCWRRSRAAWQELRPAALGLR